MSQDTDQNSRTEALETLWDIIKDIRVAMMSTAEADGQLRSRPMYTQEANAFDSQLWFFTRDDSGKVREILRDASVNLSYASADDNRYASVSGRAQVIDDPAKERELWRPALKAWFPDGLDDPHLTLIRVNAEQAEYWDGPSSSAVNILHMVKAAVTGSYDGGDNEKVKL